MAENNNIRPSASSQLLRIDTSGLYEEVVGREGVARAEFARYAGDTARVHDDVQARSRHGLDADFACLNLHTAMQSQLKAIVAEAARLRRFSDVVILGIGGSNLGAMAVLHALAAAAPLTGPRLHFLDNIEPDLLHQLLERLHPGTTAVLAISKSGGTLETVSQYLALREWLKRTLGPSAREHQWIVTDPAQGWLRELADKEDIGTLPVPPRVGGRYSVMTAVGLLPLAVAGVDVAALLAGADANAARCATPEPAGNPALEIATLYFLLDTRKEKRLSVLMPYVNSLRLFGDWYRQLWAESLGKTRADGTPAGTLPVTALGAVDQHSQLQMYLESRRDKVFAFIALDRWRHDRSIPLDDSARGAFPYLGGRTLGELLDAEFHATRQVIGEYGHPHMTLHLSGLDAHALGQLIDLYQRVTVYAGLLYGIDPLDQPAVERGKRLAIERLRVSGGG